MESRERIEFKNTIFYHFTQKKISKNSILQITK